jgi:hypothetical protein
VDILTLHVNIKSIQKEGDMHKEIVVPEEAEVPKEAKVPGEAMMPMEVNMVGRRLSTFILSSKHWFLRTWFRPKRRHGPRKGLFLGTWVELGRLEVSQP